MPPLWGRGAAVVSPLSQLRPQGVLAVGRRNLWPPPPGQSAWEHLCEQVPAREIMRWSLPKVREEKPAVESPITFSTRFAEGPGLERSLTIRASTTEEAKRLYQEMHALLEEFATTEAKFRANRQALLERQRQELGAIEQRARERDLNPAQGRQSGNGQVVCPQHGKALMGKYGLYCPTRLPDGGWCNWRPKKEKVA